jgi:hypothetical protein
MWSEREIKYGLPMKPTLKCPPKTDVFSLSCCLGNSSISSQFGSRSRLARLLLCCTVPGLEDDYQAGPVQHVCHQESLKGQRLLDQRAEESEQVLQRL